MRTMRDLRRRYATFSLNNAPIINRAYLIGDKPPHYQMPAIPMQIEHREDGWPVLVETYNSSSVTIMHIGNAADLYNW